MLKRYFSAMVSKIKQAPGFLDDDTRMIDHLRQNGFSKADVDDEFQNAKRVALEHIETAKRNGGKLPVVVRMIDIKTDTEESSYAIENFLKPGTDAWSKGSDAWLRRKIIFAVNNGKAIEICAPED